MNPKTLQYLMGHSNIGVTMNTYTHLGLEDAQDEMIRMEELNAARAEVNKTTELNGGSGITDEEKKIVNQSYYSSQSTYPPRYYQRNAVNRTVIFINLDRPFII